MYNVNNLHRVERLIPCPPNHSPCPHYLPQFPILLNYLALFPSTAAGLRPLLSSRKQSLFLVCALSLSLSISISLTISVTLAQHNEHNIKTIIKMKSNKTMKMKNNNRNQNSNNNMKYMYEQHDQQHPHPSAGKLSLYLQVEIVVYTTYIYIVLVEIVKSFSSGCVCGLSPKSPSHLIANVSSLSSYSMFGILDPP